MKQASSSPDDWTTEVRVTFDRDEMESFFDSFSPLDNPIDLLQDDECTEPRPERVAYL